VTEADDELRAAWDGGLNEEILEELFALRSAADFRALRAVRPELAAALVKNQLRELAAAPGYGVGFARLLSLLDATDADIDVVWAEYERGLNEATAAGEELAAEESAVREALDRGDVERVLELTTWRFHAQQRPASALASRCCMSFAGWPCFVASPPSAAHMSKPRSKS